MSGVNKRFIEEYQICEGFLPIAMNTQANDGDWVSLKNYGKLVIMFYKGVGTAGQDPTITLEQATTITGTSAKALPFTRVDKKQAATNLQSTGTFTKSTSASPATNDTFTPASGTWTNSDLAEQAAIVVIEILAEDLDVDGGFDCVRARVADVGTNNQVGGVHYMLGQPRYGKETLDSAIVN